MTPDDIIKNIQSQLNALDEIADRIDKLRPDPNQYSGLYVKYLETDTRPILRSYKSWRTVTLALLQSWLGDDDSLVELFQHTVTYKMPGFDIKRELQNNIDEGHNVLESLITKLKLTSSNYLHNSNLDENIGDDSNSPFIRLDGCSFDSSVFIVHGHDNALKQEVARTLEHLGLKPIILHEQANHGQTIIEKFEEHANVGFAIILYTQCDLGIAKRDYGDGAALKPRARQNVVFEHGYFIARLGRSRVMAILDEGVEKPGDLDGIVYTTKLHWREELVKELKAAGYAIDANKLYP